MPAGGHAIRAARQVTSDITTSDASGSWLQSLVIVGNELIGTVGLFVPTDANGPWIKGLVMTGNTYQPGTSGTNAMVQIDSVLGFNITGNSIINWRSEAVYPFITGSNADRGTVGSVAISGSAAS
jgi:hypothetical protein